MLSGQNGFGSIDKNYMHRPASGGLVPTATIAESGLALGN